MKKEIEELSCDKADFDNLEFIFNYYYHNNTTCEECDQKFCYHKVSNRKCYACSYCGYQIHPLANTIFHKSSTSLKDWFYAIFLYSTSEIRISAKELQRQLGVTYKTAWRIKKSILLLAHTDSELLNQIYEYSK